MITHEDRALQVVKQNKSLAYLLLTLPYFLFFRSKLRRNMRCYSVAEDYQGVRGIHLYLLLAYRA